MHSAVFTLLIINNMFKELLTFIVSNSKAILKLYKGYTYMKNILTGAALLLASSSAFAGLITETGTFGTQGSSTNVSLGTLNSVISINSFDTLLGTLTGVEVTVFGQIDSEGASTNTTTVNGRAEVVMQMQQPWQVTTTAADDYVFVAPNFNYLSEQSSVSDFDMAPGSTFNFSLTSGELSSVLTGVNLAAFSTGSAVDFNFMGQPSTFLSNGLESGTGNFVNSVATGSWGKVEVEYTYTAKTAPATVSEPGTIAILALGLVGFAAARRKKSV